MISKISKMGLKAGGLTDSEMERFVRGQKDMLTVKLKMREAKLKIPSSKSKFRGGKI